MVLFFESHPVQYKAPVFARLAQLVPGQFKVVYASDCSVRGHLDREFGQTIAWNTPLLQGYPFVVLHNERGTPLRGFRSLTGRGIDRLLREEKPAAAVLGQFLYAFDLAAYLGCRRLGIPIWIRQETQDEASPRTPAKALLRSLLYRAAYAPVRHAFYFGALNREHLLRHGVAPERLSFAPFCTPDPIVTDRDEKAARREKVRRRFGIEAGETLLLFSGKFIAKKNPELVLEAFAQLPDDLRRKVQVLFVGAGELESALRTKAAAFPGRIHFAGLINQAEIFDYYLAADLLLLPSRRAGETWGLVVNEALQAGCGVIMSEAVGCAPEFRKWERVRVIPVGDAPAAARAIAELAKWPRDFDWCADAIRRYSVEEAAAALARQIAGATSAASTN
jgi:glycosyltransferase involved in cell wall biosynthesis